MDFARPKFFKQHPWAGYPAAIGLVAAATAVTSILWLAVDRPASAPIFLAAIVVSTLIGGFRVGVVSAVLGGLALDYFFIQPFYQLTLARDDVFRWVFFVIEGGFVSWITEKLRTATEDLRRSRGELRELTRHQQTLREEEQRRIAREIHDELGQMLTGLKLGIHLLRKKTDDAGRDEIGPHLDELSSRVDSTIGSVRRIASEIRPSILDDFGLIAAIEWQVSDFEQKSGVECSLVANIDSVDLSQEAGAAVYRIVQEALTNVARHADATAVSITVTSSDQELTVDIEDNGCGIDLKKLTSHSLGLIGMRERARLIAAKLDVRPRSQGGTTVELTVPIPSFENVEMRTT